MAGNEPALLSGRMARSFFYYAGKERGLAGHIHPLGYARFARPARPRGSADRLLHRDDGVVAAYASARSLSQSSGSVFVTRRRPSLPARRNLAGLFHEILRSEPAAQEDAPRITENTPALAQPQVRP